jgi:hypothetical protein
MISEASVAPFALIPLEDSKRRVVVFVAFGVVLFTVTALLLIVLEDALEGAGVLGLRKVPEPVTFITDTITCKWLPASQVPSTGADSLTCIGTPGSKSTSALMEAYGSPTVLAAVSTPDRSTVTKFFWSVIPALSWGSALGGHSIGVYAPVPLSTQTQQNTVFETETELCTLLPQSMSRLGHCHDKWCEERQCNVLCDTVPHFYAYCNAFVSFRVHPMKKQDVENIHDGYSAWVHLTGTLHCTSGKGMDVAEQDCASQECSSVKSTKKAMRDPFDLLISPKPRMEMMETTSLKYFLLLHAAQCVSSRPAEKPCPTACFLVVSREDPRCVINNNNTECHHAKIGR